MKQDNVLEEYTPKILMYATTDNGDGFVQLVGTYESIEEIEIRAGMFSKDVLLTFQYETKKTN